MKSHYKIFLMATAVLAAASCNGWTEQELELIQGGPELMRVLSIDDPSDKAVLRKKSAEIPAGEIKSEAYAALCRKMLTTVTDPTQDGVGIAAPQVGISRRLVAVQRFDKEGEPFEFYPNIRITERRGDSVPGGEGCLSIPDRYGSVLRSRDITVSYTSPATLRDTSEDVGGFTAVIFQHECDHLDGVVFTDRIWEESASWYRGASPSGVSASPDSAVAGTLAALSAVFPRGGAPADVFYLVSTNVNSSYDEHGNEVYNAVLSPGELALVDRELAYVQKNMFGDSLNFYSPRYHQVTMNGFFHPEVDKYFNRARLEVLDAFDHYIKYENGGRPFVLAGFSQGGMMVLEILKHIDADTYPRMQAAYVIGYGIDAQTASCPFVKPASGPDDVGACYSHNTVTDTAAIWQEVYNNSVCCINPANWCVDSTPATFEFNGQSITTSVDTLRHVVISSTYTDPRTNSEVRGCLHVQDLLFYAPFIRRNALDRIFVRQGE